MSTIIDETTGYKSYMCIVQLCVQGGDYMEKEAFIKRLVDLRLSRGVSARDMSLSLGQSAGYINNIENGVNYPSMSVFFYICDYFGLTPKEFFDTDIVNPTKAQELLSAASRLNGEQLDHLIAIVKGLR